MAKRWTIVAHPGYFESVRAVPDSDRYALVTAIWQTLEFTDDPSTLGIPVKNRLGYYELVLGAYTVLFEIIKQRDEIKLLVIR